MDEDSRVVVLMWNKIRDRDGSITLEAALAIPIFLTFFLSLVTLIQVALVEMALQAAVTETVKQLAHHYEPVHLVQKKGESLKNEWSDKAGIPDFVDPLIDFALGQASEAALPPVLTPVLRMMADSSILDKKHLRVVAARFPHPTDRSRANIEIEAEYRMEVRLPFYQTTIVVRKKAWERAWYGSDFE